MRDNPFVDEFVKVTLAPAVRTNATVNGTGVDLSVMPWDTAGSGATTYLGGEGAKAMFVIVTGAVTDGTHTITLEESADNSTYTTVAAGDLTAGTVPASFTSADANKVFEAAYNGNKRFVRVKLVTSGATTGGLSAGFVIVRPSSRLRQALR